MAYFSPVCLVMQSTIAARRTAGSALLSPSSGSMSSPRVLATAAATTGPAHALVPASSNPAPQSPILYPTQEITLSLLTAVVTTCGSTQLAELTSRGRSKHLNHREL